MAYFVTWITTFLLCAGYMFPYELKSVRNDVAAQKVSESSINLNLINKDLLSTEKDTSKKLKRSLRDTGNHWLNSGKLNERKPTVTVNRQRSRRGDQENNSFSPGVYNKPERLKHLAERRNEDSSEISQFPARETRDRCYNDADCQKLIVNGFCNKSVHGNFCSCPNSYIQDFLECLPRVNLGGICNHSLQCPRNSVCDYGTCACDYGYITKERECVKGGKNQCYNDEDCSRNHLNNSYCAEDVAGNLCLCPAGYVASSTDCLPHVKLGGSCKISLQCLSNSVCTNDTCTCRSDYIQEGLACVKPHLGKCSEYIGCPEYSECRDGFCVCADGYNKVNSTCVWEERNQCYSDEDCWRDHLNNSYCVEDAAGNWCQCPTGYVASETECLPYVKLGGICKLSLQCLSNSVCINGTCTCRSGYIQEGLACVKEKSNQCYNDEDCWRNHLNNSHCVQYAAGSLCQCPAGSFVSKTECLPYVVQGGTCKLSLQCLSDSVCINGTCTCRSDYIQEGRACIKPHLRMCSEYPGCPEYSECRNGFCVCVEGYSQENFKCVLERINQCYNDEDCARNHLKNSYCVKNVTGNLCQCPAGYVASKTECLPYVELGGTCKLSIQCLSNSVCINDNCTCKEAYIEEGLSCVKEKNLGKCSEYTKCPVHSECKNGFCVCVEGYIKYHLECEREFDQECYNGNDCQEKYYLENGVMTCSIGFPPYYENQCECPNGYALGKNGCLLKKKLGESCNEKVQCPFMTSCTNGTCVCDEEEKYFIVKNGRCTGRTVGDPCYAGSYCSDHSDCVNDTCTCHDHYINMGHFCKYSFIGDPCTETRECPDELGICRNGRCMCKDGYETDIEKRKCVAQFYGGFCNTEDDCPSWGECLFGVCVCAFNFVKEGQVCVRSKEYPGRGTTGWVLGLITIAVAVVIMILGLLICRWKEKQKRKPLPTVSAAVDTKLPRHSTSIYQKSDLKPLLNQLLHAQQQKK